MRPAGRQRAAARTLRALRFLGLALLTSTALAAPEAPTAPAASASAPADCPPTATAPTPEQVRNGLRDARDHGLLWRVEKDGRVGWLYGTLHVGRMDWAFPGPQLSAALRQSDAVALELDLGDPQVLADLQRASARLAQAEQQHPLPAALQARLAQATARDCLGSAMQGQPALMQALTLTVLAGRRDGLDPGWAQEQVLSGFARASGKRLHSLEDAATQIDALAPERPQDLAATIDTMLTQLESGQTRAQMAEVAETWARGDLARLERYEQWCGCMDSEDDRRYARRLVEGRNPALADRIGSLMAQGPRLLAAVGALHMTGPQGLPELLRQRGWTVQRIEAGTPR